MEAFSRTDTLVAQYQDAFQRMLDEYRGRLATHTALVTDTLTTTVNKISKLYTSSVHQNIRFDAACRI